MSAIVPGKKLTSTTALKMRQIEVAQWVGDNGKPGYSIIGLGADGKVYRYQANVDGWIPYSMTIAHNSGYSH